MNESKRRRRRAVDATDIRDNRPDLVKRVCWLPNVRSTMIALRIKSGEVTDELCLSVLVSVKEPQETLAKTRRIPRSVRVGSRSIPVDVLELRRMRPQNSIFPPKGPIGILVINATGTIGAFAGL